MNPPGEVQGRIWDLQRAAEAADAAAAHLRRAADRLREGDTAQCLAERKLAQDLLQPLLPSRPLQSAPVVGPVDVGRWARSLEALRVLADYLKILVPLAVVLGLLTYSVLSGWSGDMTRGYHEMSPKDAARSTAYPKP
jgi:hypothetical protein